MTYGKNVPKNAQDDGLYKPLEDAASYPWNNGDHDPGNDDDSDDDDDDE